MGELSGVKCSGQFSGGNIQKNVSGFVGGKGGIFLGEFCSWECLGEFSGVPVWFTIQDCESAFSVYDLGRRG